MNKYTFLKLSDTPTDSQVIFLYELLKIREYSISHKKMPSFQSHKNFVLNNPYSQWFILKYDEVYVGSLYINMDNSVGIHFLTEYRHIAINYLKSFEDRFKPLKGIPSIRSKFFSFNISPKDNYMAELLIENGYQVKQVTYQKETNI